MLDGISIGPKRALLALATVVALGAAMAPGQALEPVQATDPALATSSDATLPRFEPAAEPAVPEIAEPAVEDTDEWTQYGSGVASYYASRFDGRRTASGERFDNDDYTAAHRTLPFGTKVRLTRGERTVVVTINDRGPFSPGRVIDVSQAAARDLGLIGPGHGTVTLALLDDHDGA